jgi:hypothetical protein
LPSASIRIPDAVKNNPFRPCARQPEFDSFIKTTLCLSYAGRLY